MEPALIKITSRLKTEAEEKPFLSGRGFLQVAPATLSVSTANSRPKNIWKSSVIPSFPPFTLDFRGCEFHLFTISLQFMVPILSSIGFKIILILIFFRGQLREQIKFGGILSRIANSSGRVLRMKFLTGLMLFGMGTDQMLITGESFRIQ
jgi:hypothetical protein